MRRIGIASATFVLMLAGAGCGGGSNDAANETGGETAITEESTPTDTSASTDEVSTDGTTDTVDSVGGLSGECTDLVQASQAFGAAVASSLGSGDSELGDTADLYRAFADSAPDELKDAFETLADLMAGYATALADLDLQSGETPSPEQIAKLAKISQSLSTTEAQEASQTIATWTKENCDPNP
jgi:ABC-type transporter Mla subunit MlaD